MMPCPADQADLLLDGQSWRLTTVAEANQLRTRLAGLKGIRWVDWNATVTRLSHQAAPDCPASAAASGDPRHQAVPPASPAPQTVHS